MKCYDKDQARNSNVLDCVYIESVFRFNIAVIQL